MINYATDPLKENALNLVREHKANCNDPECNISSTLIHVLLDKAGIYLTPEEKAELA